MKKGLLTGNPIYKPFRYPWCYDAWLTQQRIHWLPEEVPMSEDVKDWATKITPAEKNLLTQIFRFFTQADVEVNNYYMGHCMHVFKPTEVKMMLSVFSAMETVHMAAYAHLLDTIGLPETEYAEFLKIKAMKDKYDYLQGCKSDSLHNIAKTVAICSAFTEGVQLFASFAILLNFPRHNKMKGMGQIITWSVRDETLHCNSMIRLFRELIDENPEVWTERLREEIYTACSTAVGQEDAMIDLAFEQGPLENLTKEDVKLYIRWIANRRLVQLGLKAVYKVVKNPLTWLDAILNAVEHMNFFEGRSTEYSKAATRGTWAEAFDELESPYFNMLEKNKIVGEKEFFKPEPKKQITEQRLMDDMCESCQ